ncbi:hypothetical protein J6590_073536 [Homalodisca vitripennis]|nr:hypothetical protein J6590_073536 [Homalodisca vitripennis]
MKRICGHKVRRVRQSLQLPVREQSLIGRRKVLALCGGGGRGGSSLWCHGAQFYRVRPAPPQQSVGGPTQQLKVATTPNTAQEQEEGAEDASDCRQGHLGPQSWRQ